MIVPMVITATPAKTDYDTGKVRKICYLFCRFFYLSHFGFISGLLFV